MFYCLRTYQTQGIAVSVTSIRLHGNEIANGFCSLTYAYTFTSKQYHETCLFLI